MASIPEQKFQNFRFLLCRLTTKQEEKDLLAALTYPLFLEGVRLQVLVHYETLLAYEQNPAPSDEGAREWVRSFFPQVADDVISRIVASLPHCTAEQILLVARYLKYFCEVVVLRDNESKR